jgi:hypothetical protein
MAGASVRLALWPRCRSGAFSASSPLPNHAVGRGQHFRDAVSGPRGIPGGLGVLANYRSALRTQCRCRYPLNTSGVSTCPNAIRE